MVVIAPNAATLLRKVNMDTFYARDSTDRRIQREALVSKAGLDRPSGL